MEDPTFKKKYQKYKLRVKLWERDFKKKNSRPPSKYDIREASQEIRDSYKMYYKLKTSLLEDTLNDVIADDGFDISEISDATNVFDESPNKLLASLPLDISGLVNGDIQDAGEAERPEGVPFSNLEDLPNPKAISNLVSLNEDHVLKNFEAVEDLALNEQAWGENVSKKPKEEPKQMKSKQLMKNQAIKSNLSEKLFKTSSFSKRNPRRSLNRSHIDLSLQKTAGNELTNYKEQQEVLPDLETILLEKAKEQSTAVAPAIVGNPLLAGGGKSREMLKPSLDEGWLQRTCGEGDPKHASPALSRESPHDEETAKRRTTYGLANIDVSKIIPVQPSQPSPNAEVASSTVQSPLPDFTSTRTKGTSMLAEEHGDNRICSDDSIVSDSEGENNSDEYRHVAKRRRILVVNSQDNQEQMAKVEAAKPIQPQKMQIMTHNETMKEINVQKKKNISGSEAEKEFSADDDGDEDYKPPEIKVKKRAKVVAKRNKPQAEAKAHPTGTSTKGAGKRVASGAGTRKATRKKVPTKNEHQQEEEEEKPLDPEDIKYAMVLERVELTSAPRINSKEMEQVNEMALSYINKLSVPKSTGANAKGTAHTVVDEKREAARKKLEEKIASGRLNENFVTVNLQKKIYSRGHKSVNYSRYKKKQWKHKKRIAALSGPNMDMGGCDGGILTCFQCGQPGHFAQNCKMKGDSLLPLSAEMEIDDSPFPTLCEAEKMAEERALTVHGSNIRKLPQAKNSAIYASQEHIDTEDVDIGEEEKVRDSENEEGEDDTFEKDKILMETDDELEGMDLDKELALSRDQYLEKVQTSAKKIVGHKIPEDFLKAAGLDTKGSVSGLTDSIGNVGALYDLNPDGSVMEVTAEVFEALRMFGHTNFRKGQDRAIMRILSGLSTLVTLSTGSGKSLCYQLPAYLYSRQKRSITLVISPLVSLMEDQVTGVPHFLRAHCLHTNQTPQQRVKIMKTIADGEIDILLVSPEAVVAGERSTGFGAILRQLPPIAFACIDEAHCVSQWSHNFRPSYLMICKVLKKNLGVKTVLGLTATATLPTRMSIIDHLGITDGENGIISDIPLPDNLTLSVSKDENRDAALLQLLMSERFNACQSIIIYCTRRDECERISAFLRTSFQDRKEDLPHQSAEGGKRKRKRINWHAEPYHAGLPSSRRRTIQNAFMNNELRIVVATIAFGMGINKPDIRAVVHYNMPKNFESYVQEIGRAGRDGKVAHCHLFLDPRGNDQNELRRHIYANSIDRHVIRKLLQRVFVPCSCNKAGGEGETKGSSSSTDKLAVRARKCPGHEIGFSIEKTVEALDIPAENISTLLCYMELDPRWGLNVLSNAYIRAKVISYGGPKYLKHAAKECAPLAMAIALEIKRNKFDESANIIEFSVIDIAAAIGWNSGVVKYQLKNLEWTQVNGYPRRSPLNVNFYDLGFRIKAPGDFSAEEIDEALDTLYNRSVKQEHTQLIQLQYVYQGLSSVAYNTYVPCGSGSFSTERSEQLKAIIRDYFRNDYPQNMKLEADTTSIPDEDIINDVVAMINMYPDNSFSGRNIARIFHGISSPNYPALMWSRCKFWRSHSKTDFNRIVQLANAVIVKWRS